MSQRRSCTTQCCSGGCFHGIAALRRPRPERAPNPETLGGFGAASCLPSVPNENSRSTRPEGAKAARPKGTSLAAQVAAVYPAPAQAQALDEAIAAAADAEAAARGRVEPRQASRQSPAFYSQVPPPGSARCRPSQESLHSASASAVYARAVAAAAPPPAHGSARCSSATHSATCPDLQAPGMVGPAVPKLPMPSSRHCDGEVAPPAVVAGTQVVTHEARQHASVGLPLRSPLASMGDSTAPSDSSASSRSSSLHSPPQVVGPAPGRSAPGGLRAAGKDRRRPAAPEPAPQEGMDLPALPRKALAEAEMARRTRRMERHRITSVEHSDNCMPQEPAIVGTLPVSAPADPRGHPGGPSGGPSGGQLRRDGLFSPRTSLPATPRQMHQALDEATTLVVTGSTSGPAAPWASELHGPASHVSTPRGQPMSFQSPRQHSEQVPGAPAAGPAFVQGPALGLHGQSRPSMPSFHSPGERHRPGISAITRLSLPLPGAFADGIGREEEQVVAIRPSARPRASDSSSSRKEPLPASLAVVMSVANAAEQVARSGPSSARTSRQGSFRSSTPLPSDGHSPWVPCAARPVLIHSARTLRTMGAPGKMEENAADSSGAAVGVAEASATIAATRSSAEGGNDAGSAPMHTLREELQGRVASGRPAVSSACRSCSSVTLESEVLHYVLQFMCATELCRRCGVSRAWANMCGVPELWKSLGERHLAGSRMQRPSCRAEFLSCVTGLRQTMLAEKADTGPSYMEDLLEFARCAQPLLTEGDGAHNLALRGTHVRLVILLRMDAETAWVAQLPPAEQSKLFLQGAQLLSLLCARSEVARSYVVKNLTQSAGSADLAEVLQERCLHHLRRLRALAPEPGLRRFGSLDCTTLEVTGLGLTRLKSLARLYFGIFGATCGEEGAPLEGGPAWMARPTGSGSQREAAAEPDPTKLANILSTQWCSAMCLRDRRVDGIPGNWELRFDPSGSVEGTGSDVWGSFTLSGTWTASGLVLLRKEQSAELQQQVVSVDLLGFFDPRAMARDGSTAGLRGLWLFQGQAGGFWAWRGEPRELQLPVPASRLRRTDLFR